MLESAGSPQDNDLGIVADLLNMSYLDVGSGKDVSGTVSSGSQQ